MAWDGYITNLMAGEPPYVLDAAICGCEAGKESVWAATPGGKLISVTAAEIKALVAKDHSSMFSNGLTIAGCKCTLLRDNLHTDGDHSMDVKMRPTATDTNSYSITIAMSAKTFVIVMGMKDVPGGKVNIQATKMATYLRQSSF